jgi:hypothetical protein
MKELILTASDKNSAGLRGKKQKIKLYTIKQLNEGYRRDQICREPIMNLNKKLTRIPELRIRNEYP